MNRRGLDANQSNPIGGLDPLPWLPAPGGKIHSKQLDCRIARASHKKETAVGTPLDELIARQGAANRPGFPTVYRKQLGSRNADGG
jgi:hypothetical protein